jgi:hypothetical protein
VVGGAPMGRLGKRMIRLLRELVISKNGSSDSLFKSILSTPQIMTSTISQNLPVVFRSTKGWTGSLQEL